MREINPLYKMIVGSIILLVLIYTIKFFIIDNFTSKDNTDVPIPIEETTEQ